MTLLAKYLKCVVLVAVLFLGSVNVYAHQTSAQQPKVKQSDLVVFNTKTLKYHELDCSSAIRCTKNCIQISRNEAIRRGAVHCKKCTRRH